NARELHNAEHRPEALAADDYALSTIFWKQKRFTESLRVLDPCITESQAAHDQVMEGYCHMEAGAVLGEVGYFEGARRELELAKPLLVMDRDLASLHIVLGSLDQNYGLGPLRQSYNAQAVVEFERASAFASAAARTWDKRRAELNLVYSLAETG